MPLLASCSTIYSTVQPQMFQEQTSLFLLSLFLSKLPFHLHCLGQIVRVPYPYVCTFFIFLQKLVFNELFYCGCGRSIISIQTAINLNWHKIFLFVSKHVHTTNIIRMDFCKELLSLLRMTM